jgi:DNA repair exonuclease SbcCD ATPase subunit
MIKLKDLTAKNFLSIGNVVQAIDFNREQLTLVLGENLDQGGDDSGSRNGTGKSTIINALSYALYGQALTNIKKGNLINKTNGKGMLVTLNFERNGVSYRIERGRSPNVLKYYVNGAEQVDETMDESQGDSRRTQESINDVVGMSHDMFKHIVALNTYTDPFLSMRSGDQRQIIEQLLGITILSEKAESLKEQIKLTKDAIQEENSRINAVQTSNEKIKQSIESLKSRQRAWNLKKSQDVERFVESIAELEKLDIESELLKHEKLASWTEVNNKRSSLTKELSALESAYMQSDKTLKKVQKDIAELDNALCYACGQTLHDHKKSEILEKKQKELSDVERYLSEVGFKVEVIVNSLAELGEAERKPATFYETAREAYEHRNNVDSLIKSMESRKVEVDPYQDQIDDLNNTAMQEIDWKVMNDLNTLKEHQEFLLKLLTSKDSFIRKKIIDQNLAYLNARLSYYLETIGLPHQVVFQNDLSVEITQLGQDLDFDNLSRGERNRLILGLSWAFRDVWESLYEGVNLLFIDELIDSGMDTAGVENSIAILKKMARERDKNIFLISHKDELIGRVNNVLKVIKENGFTSYENDIDIIE